MSDGGPGLLPAIRSAARARSELRRGDLGAAVLLLCDARGRLSFELGLCGSSTAAEMLRFALIDLELAVAYAVDNRGRAGVASRRASDGPTGPARRDAPAVSPDHG